ncbi:hypothetical protein [Haloechinothrix sp. LS1_15]|uniref:hypothetical protein n=1 Tax=Haloechinothrix sp. LS1_15 TaxID=2652248 RepID=UPI0029487544|nr:hypothetical protein [Haloechinothrix sp. LS1_15]MDV6011144.1 hypothetical protein [Haloechinothrix sp. LS1_15]
MASVFSIVLIFFMYALSATFLGARSCVSTGYLSIADVRWTKVMSRIFLSQVVVFFFLLVILFAALASPSPSSPDRPEISGVAGLYSVLLLVVVGTLIAAFGALRSWLWRSNYFIYGSEFEMAVDKAGGERYLILIALLAGLVLVMLIGAALII